MFNIYFIRHGETDYNVEHRIQGQCDRSSNPEIKDMSLNENGINQVKKVADFINNKGIVFDAILSSPLKRAVETAEIIMAKQKTKKIIIEERFRENFSGADYEGMNIDDFKKIEFLPPLKFNFYNKNGSYTVSNGKEMRDFYENSDSIYNYLANIGGERKIDVKNRVKTALTEFINKNKDCNNLCISCHKIMMKFFLEEISETPITNIKNGEIFHVTYDLKSFFIKDRFPALL